MLNTIEGLGPDVVGFDAQGVVTAQDYEERLVPAIDRVLESGRRPRFLYLIGPAFERFELGAMLADAKVGFGHLWEFERIAVVTDRDWISRSVGAFGVLIPCPVRTFGCAQLREAESWIATQPGDALDLSIEVVGSVAHLHVRLRGSLDHLAEDNLVRAAKEGVGDAKEVRVLVEAVDFHGWRDLRALWRHIRFVAGIRPRIERVAIVGDAKWQRRMVATARHVLRVDARFFSRDQLAEAKAWLEARVVPPVG